MTTTEKRRLGTALTQLSPDNLNKALLIIAQSNPSFQATAEEVDVDIDAQVTPLSLSSKVLFVHVLKTKVPVFDWVILRFFFVFLTERVHLMEVKVFREGNLTGSGQECGGGEYEQQQPQ